MESTIKEVFPYTASAGNTKNNALSYEEENAIRYAAGYVIWSLTKKVGCSSHVLKQEILLCLKELTGKILIN